MAYYNFLNNGYEIIPVNLPTVQIYCSDKEGREIITVWEDCTGQTLHAVLDSCEVAYENWREARGPFEE